MIVNIVGEMDGAAAYLGPIREHGFMDMVPKIALAAKRRNKRRVDIHHPAQEIIRNLDKLQKAGQAHKVGARLPAVLKYLPAELLTGTGCFRGNHHRSDIGGTSTLQREGVGMIGKHHIDAGVQAAVAYMVEQILQRCAAAAR